MHQREVTTIAPVRAGTPSVGSDLSPREREVVALIARGLSNAEICRELYLSPNTIKSHIRRAYRSMNVASRTQAVIWAHHHGLVGAGEPRRSGPTGR